MLTARLLSQTDHTKLLPSEKTFKGLYALVHPNIAHYSTVIKLEKLQSLLTCYLNAEQGCCWDHKH